MKKIFTEALSSFVGKKKATSIVGIFLLIAGLIYSFSLQNSITLQEAPTAQVSPAFVVASPSATPMAGHGGTLATVVSVVDGDTIKIEGGEVVRYIGMNTPETVAPRRPVECYGKEASAKNKELVQGKTVELEKDISERDTFGRLLRYVWIGDVLLNEYLVREGYAQVSTYPPDVKYVDRLLAAQRLAVEEKKGMWSGECEPIAPVVTPEQLESTPSATSTP
jgi:micrococcal nuclease